MENINKSTTQTKKKIIVWDNTIKKIINVFENYIEASREYNLGDNAMMFACRINCYCMAGKRNEFKTLNGFFFFFEDSFNEELFNKKIIEFYKEECKVCCGKFISIRGLATHIQTVHEMTSEEYTIKYLLNGVEPKCKVCDNSPRYCTFSYKEYCKDHSNLAMSKGGKIGGIAEAWNKGKTKVNDKRILKQSLEMKGPGNHFFGKKHTEDSISSISIKKRLSENDILGRLEKCSSNYDFPNFSYKDYESRQQKINCVCKKCTRKYQLPLSYLERGFLCRVCYPRMTSKEEIAIGDYIESLGLSIIRNDRSLISPKEIDIYVPEKKYAIEFNGLYWHMIQDYNKINEEKSYHVEIGRAHV
jgi:hypothetical protein